MDIREKLKKFRELMKKNNIDYYVIPSSDAHQSEYVADYYRGREFLSGFTGSAGTLLVGLEKAILWTDGRYFIQAENQLKGSTIEMYKMRIPGWPTLEEYLDENMKDGETLGFDGKVFSAAEYSEFLNISKDINIKMDKDLVDELWSDRPDLPMSEIFIHEVKYSGKSAKEKISQVRKEMVKKGAENYVISSLDDIAWLFNIRGNDVENNPVVISYAIITMENAFLYVDNKKVTDIVLKSLHSEGIEIKDYNKIGEDIKTLKKSILIDEDKVSAYILDSIDKNVRIIKDLNITTKMKAIKNEVELKNLRECQVYDGVAMVKFIKWLKENVPGGKVTEISVSERLREFRSEIELFKDESFGTIAGYMDHAAMMHYSATPESQYTLKPEGFLLVDSGGQYLNGTTDITRTFALGKLTDEMIRDFTLVLRGHIGLSMAKFLKGTTGANLDVLARKPLWEHGIDYKCGTGHGLGYFLNVHEGPQSISPRPINVPLEVGMVTTNEPGVYKQDKYGIRTENTIVVVEDSSDEEMGTFYKFDTISLCPIDLDAVDVNLLTSEERNWLNAYHKEVYDKLSPYLNQEEKEFLRKETREV